MDNYGAVNLQFSHMPRQGKSSNRFLFGDFFGRDSCLGILDKKVSLPDYAPSIFMEKSSS